MELRNGIQISESNLVSSMDDISLFSANRFRIVFPRISDSVFWAQSVSPPSISLSTRKLPVGAGSVGITGTQLENGPLGIEFLIDENMTSWKTIYMWLYGMRDPNDSSSAPDDWREEKSDCEILALNNAYQPIARFLFVGCVPESIDGFTLDTKADSTRPVTFNSSFAFDEMDVSTKDEVPDDVILDRPPS